MALLPRWNLMTSKAKALTRSLIVSLGLLIASFWLLRILIPWVLIALAVYWFWRAAKQ